MINKANSKDHFNKETQIPISRLAEMNTHPSASIPHYSMFIFSINKEGNGKDLITLLDEARRIYV